jgi:hypothetical protein
MAVDPIEYKGVRFDEKFIANVQDGKIFRKIKKENILELILRSGYLAPLPLPQSILGILFFLPGLYALKAIIEWITTGGNMSTTILWLLFNFPIGIWIFLDSLKKGFYLKIILSNKTEKIVFNKIKCKSELIDFINNVKNKHSYNINTNAIY